ncbi:MAG: 3-dehydroquinate synthase [Francisellaceae bacterium]
MKPSIKVSPRGKPHYEVQISQEIDYTSIIHFVKNRQLLIVSNDKVSALYLDKLLATVEPHASQVLTCLLPDGEKYKSAIELDKIYQRLIENHFNRDCILVALGGGVIGDITGFAAATYQRGVDVLQIPTTLLSQVDSSVGGKTAINHPLAKNMIGAFHQPVLVYSATDMLKTLPEREYCSGLAEVVKYGAIIDADFFSFLEQNVELVKNKDSEALAAIILKSCELKARVVKQDELECMDVRALLNFGHTFGHAIEQCQHYQGLKHGEAVGVGMVMAADLSWQLGMLDEAEKERLITLIKELGIVSTLPGGLDKKTFIGALLKDKKNTNGGITLILLTGIGQAIVDRTVSLKRLEEFLEPYFLRE